MAFIGSGLGVAASRPLVGAVCKRRSGTVVMTVPEIGITMQPLINPPAELPLGPSPTDKDQACFLAWRQVFGNAYVMESERAEVYVAESMFRAGQIPMKEFVRAMAKSSTYKRRFFECCGPYRAVELNFKHLLGRGPNSQAEISEHVQNIATMGYEADIDSFLDSEEYRCRFGLDKAPYMEFKGTYTTADEFNRMLMAYGPQGTTDKSLTGRAKLLGIENPNFVLSLDGAGRGPNTASIVPVDGGHPSFVDVANALPARPDLGHSPSDGLIKLEADRVDVSPAAVRRIEVVPGSYMYLTAAEEEAYTAASQVVTLEVSKAELAIDQKRRAIEKLEAEIAALVV